MLGSTLTIDDRRFLGRLLLYTVCGLFVTLIAIFVVSFFASESGYPGTVMDWLPPSMTGNPETDGELELLTQRWIAWIALVALVISIVSVVLLLATLRQQRRAADAAVATFEHSRQMGEAQTRAYIYPDDFYVPEFISGNPLRVHFVIKNLGKSPAFEVERLVDFQFESTEFRRRRFFYGTPPILVDMIPQGADLKVEMRRDFPLHDEEFEDLITGDRKLVVFGFLFYHDIFGRKHRKTFCHELDHRNWRADGPMEMSLSDTHNRTSLPDRVVGR